MVRLGGASPTPAAVIDGMPTRDAAKHLHLTTSALVPVVHMLN